MKDKIVRGISTFSTVFIVVFWAAVCYYAYTLGIPRALWGILFLGGSLTIYVMDEIIDTIHENRWDKTGILLFCGLISIATTTYMSINYNVLSSVRIGYALPHEYVLAILFIPVIMYFSWREFGRVFPFLILGVMLYGYYGSLAPGPLGHGGLTWTRLLQISMLEIEGIYGSLNRIVAAWVALFLLYAGLLSGYGAFDIIVRAALRTTPYIRSGVTQTAVIASAIIGSINGSRTANAAMTGSITIPMMKEIGISPELAAAVEADASSLGQILPPVMGSAGFLMASFLGVSYADVMIGATIPAIILIGSISIATHFRSVAQVPDPQITNVEEYTDSEPLSQKELMVEIVRFGIPFIFLVYALGIARYTIPTSALFTVVAMLVTGISIPILQGIYTSQDRSEIRPVVQGALLDTLDGLKTGAIVLAPVAIIVSAINIVVDILLATGVPSAITLAMVSLSGGIMLFTVIISMMVGVILGMGMPTVAAYTIVAILIAPTFISVYEVPAMGAHFFALYVALLSGITPPIASACAVTAGIAGANFMKTCFEAVRLYAPMFILPIAFVYHPEIVSSTWDAYTLWIGGIIFIGSITIIYGLNFETNSPFWAVQTLPSRIGFVVTGALIMVYPGIWVQLIMAVVAVAIFIFTKIGFRKPNLTLKKE